MIQETRYRWRIESEKGYVLQNNLTFPNLDQADNYANAYTSSFNNWVYQLVPLKKEE